MSGKLKITLWVFSGLVLGIILTLASLVYFIRHYPKRVVSETIGLSNPLDPKHMLDQAEIELRKAQTDYEKWVAMTDVCFWEVDAGKSEDARIHAEEILRFSSKYPNDWNYGNAVHKGNL